LPAHDEKSSWVLEAFMLRPIFRVYSTKSAAFSVSFLATSSFVLPVCQTLESSAKTIFSSSSTPMKLALPLVRIMKRMGPRINPWRTSTSPLTVPSQTTHCLPPDM
jgi:hypothetical protein